jgi:hypothetical protein
MKNLNPEQLAKLIELARQVAIEAPMYQHQFSSSANINWQTIHGIRALLEEVEIPFQHELEARGRKFA